MSTSELPVLGVRRRRPGVVARVRGLGVDVWILVGLVALAAAIRIVTHDNQSYWTDEALTAYEAGQPWGAMLHTFASVETTPPLYFVLIWGWARAFGTSEVALRSVSAIAGTAMVPIAYGAARELVSRRAGLLAAALVVVNPFMIWYSQRRGPTCWSRRSAGRRSGSLPAPAATRRGRTCSGGRGSRPLR